MNSNTCENCYRDCRTCSNENYDGCLSCDTNTFKFEILDEISKTGECIRICLPIGEFYIQSTNTCKACHKFCKTCYGLTSQNCLSCYTVDQVPTHYPKNIKKGNYNLVSLQNQLEKNYCQLICTSTQFWTSPEENECIACDPNCLTCSKTATNCLSCHRHDISLFNNYCLDCVKYTKNEYCQKILYTFEIKNCNPSTFKTKNAFKGGRDICIYILVMENASQLNTQNSENYNNLASIFDSQEISKIFDLNINGGYKIEEDYATKWLWNTHEENILLSISFSKVLEELVSVDLAPSKTHYYLNNTNETTGEVIPYTTKFILIPNEFYESIEIIVQLAPKNRTLEKSKEMANDAATTNRVIGSVGLATSIGASVSGGVTVLPMLACGVFIRFLQTVDMIPRLAYVNVPYGPILEDIMVTLSGSSAEITLPKSVYTVNQDYFHESTGKLTHYNLPISMFEVAPIYIIIYLTAKFINF